MFHSNLPNGQGARQAFRQLNKKKRSKLRLAQGSKIWELLVSQVFFEP